MRHMRRVNRLGRDKSHRKSMIKNLLVSLFKYERITTTVAKAKVLRKFAEKLITKAKKGDIHNRRLVARWIRNKMVLKKLFENIAPRYATRPGGYTRVIRVGKIRKGDAAELAIIELVEEVDFSTRKKEETEEQAENNE